MNTEPYKVSIIIPVYKVEDYIHRCLDSVISQTYKTIEVILVDDGSPDRCGEICDEYAANYGFVRVIHQENQGQAVARNSAAKLASGEFVVFVDSDDVIVSDHVEYLVALQIKYDADMVISRGIYWYENTPLPQIPSEDADRIMNVEEALIRMNYNQGMGAMPWAKLYRKDLVLAHPFPAGRIYEDLATIYKIIGDCKRIAYSRKRIYYWMQREGSTMRSVFNERQFAAFQATREQMAYMQEKYPAVVPSVKARHMTKICELMPLVMRSSDSKKTYRRLMQEMLYYHEVMKDKNVKQTQKLRLVSYRMGYYPARLVTALHEKGKKRYFMKD